MTTPIMESEVTFDITPNMIWNGTTPTMEELSDRVKLIRFVHQVIIIFTALSIMIAMGCSITVGDLKKGIKRPLSALIGMICQFVLLPVIGFCLSLAFDLPTPYALSILIVTCCPGGNVSSVFTYWSNGDVCLSVFMTAISTVAAVGMMPLNLLIYSRRWTNEKAVIPFINIVIGLVIIIIPVLIGMVIRWKKEKWTKIISMFGTIIGVILLITSVILDYLAIPTLFNASWRLWLSAALVPPIGFLVGYVIAFVTRRTPEHCRTIAFETGCQNMVLALALIKLTFRDDLAMQTELIKYPSMYGLFLIVYSVAFITVFRLFLRYKTDSENSFTDIEVEQKLDERQIKLDDVDGDKS